MSPGSHIELSALVRLEADYLSPDPRDAMRRLADELDSNGNPVLISRDALYDAVRTVLEAERPATSRHRRSSPGSADRGEEVPFHVRMPPYLRRTANRRPASPDRDALLRYADELEEKGDASLVAGTTLRAALRAHAAEDD